MSLDRLRAIAEALPPGPLADFLNDAVQRLEHGLPADQAMELSGPGAIRQRDALLRQAAGLTGEASDWRAAGALAKRIAQLPHRRHPEAIDRLLVASSRCATVPQSRRRLYSILSDTDDRIRRSCEHDHPRRADAA